MDQSAAIRLNQLLESAALPPLDEEVARRFQAYLELLLRWNARMNLTAIRDPEGILSRHFVECIACARALPRGIATLLDLGSGAGFPGIPIALCRPEISVTLAESQSKKAAFLHEALRTVSVPAQVFSGRAEELDSTFDCVTLRAVDRMEVAVRSASALLSPQGWLVLMVSRPEITDVKFILGGNFQWSAPVPLPLSENRIVAIGHRQA